MSFDFSPPSKEELLKQALQWADRRRHSQPRHQLQTRCREDSTLTIDEKLRAFLEYAGQQQTQPQALVQWIKDALE